MPLYRRGSLFQSVGKYLYTGKTLLWLLGKSRQDDCFESGWNARYFPVSGWRRGVQVLTVHFEC